MAASVSPAIQKVHYDPLRDFNHVGMLVTLQNILIVHPSTSAKTIQEFIANAKAQPGKINYASSGIGSPGHLAIALLESMTGISLNHVPYKGGIKGYEATNWYGLSMPAKTLANIVNRISKYFTAALNSPDVITQLKDRGIDATPSSGAEYLDFVRREQKRWIPVIKKGNIEAN